MVSSSSSLTSSRSSSESRDSRRKPRKGKIKNEKLTEALMLALATLKPHGSSKKKHRRKERENKKKGEPVPSTSRGGKTTKPVKKQQVKKEEAKNWAAIYAEKKDSKNPSGLSPGAVIVGLEDGTFRAGLPPTDGGKKIQISCMGEWHEIYLSS